MVAFFARALLHLLYALPRVCLIGGSGARVQPAPLLHILPGAGHTRVTDPPAPVANTGQGRMFFLGDRRAWDPGGGGLCELWGIVRLAALFFMWDMRCSARQRGRPASARAVVAAIVRPMSPAGSVGR